jgi:hypothetical protein
MSIYIHMQTATKTGQATLSIRIGQQKDDLLSCVVMATAASCASFRAAGVIYLIATIAILWLGRRSRARLDMMRGE